MYNKKRVLKDKGIIVMSIVSVMAISGLVAGIMISDNKNSSGITKIAELDENEQNVNANVKKETSKNASKTSDKENTDKENKSDADGENINNSDNNENAQNQEDENNTPDTADTDSPVSANGSSTDTPTDNADADNSGSDESNKADSAETSVNAPATAIGFTNQSILVWPVETCDIVIDYSMDTTTYFATLDMYKTSDAVCIRSDVGSPVFAAADGVVSLHSYNEELGHFIQMDLGNDYELTYGQLKDIQIEEGDTLAKGDLIGYIAEPTKYYTVEGANLYLKLTENNVPTDPLDYLDYEKP